MEIPSFIKDAKSGDILATKFDHLFMVEHVEINANKVRIYFFFRYDYKEGMLRNDWLLGFYGPGFSEDFYREATKTEKEFFIQKLRNCGYELHDEYGKLVPCYTHYTIDEQLFDAPKIDIKDAVEVTSRMRYIDNSLKPIADFILEYASWNLHKDTYNQPVLEVPVFRVLDALVQRGKPYMES